jgi:signal transduction histidine kinase
MSLSAAKLGEETRDIIVSRMRAGLWIAIFSIAGHAIADLWVSPSPLVEVYAIKAFQLAVVLGGFWLLRYANTRDRAVQLALAIVSILCLSTGYSGIVTQTPNTTALLLVVFAMGTATLIPWGFRAQLVTQLVAGFSIVWNAAAVNGPAGVLDYLMVAAVIGTVASLYSAYTTEHYLKERTRAAEILEETRARQHQAELAQAARLSTLGQMAAGLAHELNQPLAAIVSYARGCALRLRADEVDRARLIEVIEEISEQALRAGEVLRRIREFVRSGELHRERLDPNELVREAVRLAEAEARRLGVTIRLDPSPGAPPVDVDRIQVEQVILNLVRNGFEAMEDTAKGPRELSVRTERTALGDIEIAVHDTGGGLPADVTARIFDPFFTTKPDGLGLGLAISRSIIEAHGGRLWTSNGSGGATFHFTLPAGERGAVDGR